VITVFQYFVTAEIYPSADTAAQELFQRFPGRLVLVANSFASFPVEIGRWSFAVSRSDGEKVYKKPGFE